MNLRFHRLLIAVLLIAFSVNGFFLLPNAWKAGVNGWAVRKLSNPELRVVQWGDWYRAVMAVENQIPRGASVRLVYSSPPWYLAYYLYPRLLRAGSQSLADRDIVRERYPEEWVLVYADPPHAELTAYPPLHPRAS